MGLMVGSTRPSIMRVESSMKVTDELKDYARRGVPLDRLNLRNILLNIADEIEKEVADLEQIRSEQSAIIKEREEEIDALIERIKELESKQMSTNIKRCAKCRAKPLCREVGIFPSKAYQWYCPKYGRFIILHEDYWDAVNAWNEVN